ncbi:MAG: periplasmic heavy metal sensor [Alphaproteobacteria bacterium]|nr:periplasmic heavy metal sensor [Alphaproteobacteria bacterium]
MSRTMKIIFTLSIIANLLVAGMALGHHYRKPQGSWSAQFEEGLSLKGAEIVRTTLAEGRDEFKAMMREMKAAKEEFVAAVSVPDFNEASFDQASGKVKDSVAKVTERRFSTLKKIVLALPQEDKARFADKFIRLIQGFGKPPGKPHHKKDGDWLKSGPEGKPEQPPPGPGADGFPPPPPPVE